MTRSLGHGPTSGVSSPRAGDRSWVAAQLVLMAAVAAAGRSAGKPVTTVERAAAGAVVAAGLGLAVSAGRALGGSLTMFPQPRRGGELVTTGPFALVRHPIYSAGVMACAGYSIARGSRAAFALTGALGVFWDRKARREEALLERRYSAYAAYRRRTPRRFVPFIY